VEEEQARRRFHAPAGQPGLTSPPMSTEPIWHRAAPADRLAPGQCRTVRVAGKDLVLVHLDGHFHALDDACSHKGESLGAGHVENGCVYCPLHGWAFDVKSGACRSNPEKPIRTYPVKIENGDAWIAV
jgi:nitrite reductase (NADH) small subunit